MKILNIIILLVSIVKSSEQCDCKDDPIYINGEEITGNLCAAETIISVLVQNVKDGPEGFLVFKVKLLDQPLRGNLDGIGGLPNKDDKNKDVELNLYMPVPDQMCHSDIVLFERHKYVLSVDKEDKYLVLNLCNFAEELGNISKTQREVIRKGCPR